jgi:hypothetical protein
VFADRGVTALVVRGDDVADIGGADGTLLVELLTWRPERRGIVFDRPSRDSNARSTVQAAGLDERVEIVPGDFFESVPAADVYTFAAGTSAVATRGRVG